jgi:hypothetical protein
MRIFPKFSITLRAQHTALSRVLPHTSPLRLLVANCTLYPTTQDAKCIYVGKKSREDQGGTRPYSPQADMTLLAPTNKIRLDGSAYPCYLPIHISHSPLRIYRRCISPSCHDLWHQVQLSQERWSLVAHDSNAWASSLEPCTSVT